MLRLGDFFYAETMLGANGLAPVELSVRAGNLKGQPLYDVIGGKWDKSESLPLKVTKGAKAVPDWTYYSSYVHLISRRLLDALEAARCTGYTVNPVLIYDNKDQHLLKEEYLWIKSTVGAGPLDMSIGRGKHWNGIGFFFDPATWTGADVFLLPNYKAFFFSRRAAEAMMSIGISGLVIETCPTVGTVDWKKNPRVYGPEAIARREARKASENARLN